MSLANFYRRFLLEFSHIIWRLSQVTVGGVKEMFLWSESQHKVFVELKHYLFCTRIHTLIDLQQPFEIETNSTNYVIGVVLTQQGHLVAYHSEKISNKIREYPTYDK